VAGSRSALIVATETYDDPKLRALRAPTQDAEALGRVLADEAIGNFDVKYLINARAEQLRWTLSEFFDERDSDDLLLLHFGCHGVKDDHGRLHFAAADTKMRHLDATGVSAAFVNDRMNESFSERVVLFLDCCYSGAFGAGMTSRAGETVDIGERFEGSGRVVLTASSAMEYSFEGENRTGSGEESVFTSALVRGLESGEADSDQDGWISVEELYRYVYRQVRRTTSKQRPHKWSFMHGDVDLARSSWVAPIEDRELPSELQGMITSIAVSTRLEVVGELRTLITARPQYGQAAKEALVSLTADDSSTVRQAAEAALKSLLPPAAPAAATPAPQLVGPRPVQEPTPPAPAPPLDRPAGALSALIHPSSTWAIIAMSVTLTAVAGFAGHRLAWTIGDAVDIGSRDPGTASGAIYTGGRFLFPMAALGLTLVAARRNRWPAIITVAATAFLGAATLGALMFITFGGTRLGLVLFWMLRGAVIGAFALLGTRDWSVVAMAAGFCAIAGAVWGLVAWDMSGASQAAIILARTVLPLSVFAAVAGAVMARVEPRRSPG
jgi:hypothetical protein